MRWLIIPGSAAGLILKNALLRHTLAARLPEPGVPAFLLTNPDGTSFAVVIRRVSDDSQLLLVWTSGNPSELKLDDEPMIFIWSQPDQSTLWTLEQEELSDALERVCQLAERGWDGKALPHHWLPKKVGDHQSVFAGDRRLKDLRIAYSLDLHGQRKLLRIGSLFYAHRQEKSVQIPAVPTATLVAIPSHVDKPKEINLDVSADRSIIGEHLSPDRDVFIPLPEGENRHLFSMRYADWLSEKSPLTQQQRRVIKHSIERPLRIHGPAGSGKTLVLILKALYTLEAAHEADRPCRILLVLNSNPVRATVRTAIEAIDGFGFLATKKSDPQFLDVETLHGWWHARIGRGVWSKLRSPC
jgi:hypothetical protein